MTSLCMEGLLVLSVLLGLYAGDGQGWVQRVQQGTTGYDRYRYRYTKQRYTNSDTPTAIQLALVARAWKCRLTD